jgi:hypothetical protein
VGEIEGVRREVDGAARGLESGTVVARASCGVVDDGGGAGVHGAERAEEEGRPLSLPR